MTTRILSSLLLAAAVTAAQGQNSIVYVNAPTLYFDWFQIAQVLDMNRDAAPDFSFSTPGMICTDDVPTSGCSSPFYSSSQGTNELQTAGYDVHLNAFASSVSGEAPAETTWRAPGFPGAGLLFYWWDRFGRVVNDQLAYSGWLGPLAGMGIGYLGVRFHASDGLHYGWIRVRMPNPNSNSPNILEFGPIVVDHAYESRPNMPIRAGDIGASGDSLQFVVDFRHPDGSPHGFGQCRSVGTVILTENTLRFELHLVGGFHTAILRGPAKPHAESRPLFEFSQPLIAIHPPCTPESCPPDETVFFGEAWLNPGQIVQLHRGSLYVEVGRRESALEGSVIGAIRRIQPDAR